MKLTFKHNEHPSLASRILRFVLAISFTIDQLPIFPFFQHPTDIKEARIASAQAAPSGPVNNTSPATTINLDPNPSTFMHTPTITQKGPSMVKASKNIYEGRVIVRFKTPVTLETTNTRGAFRSVSTSSGWHKKDDFTRKWQLKGMKKITERVTRAQNQNQAARITRRQARAPQGGAARASALKESMERTAVIEVSPSADIKSVLQDLRTDPDVELAEQEQTYSVQTWPNDPMLNMQNNLGSLDQAWDITTGAGSVVAVVDSGVHITHPELAPNLWTNPGELPGNGIDDDGNGHIDDVNGWNFVNNNNSLVGILNHGTWVAGVIAAKGNNGIGIAGVAYNAKLMVIRGMDDDGVGNTTQLAQSIIYAADEGADIINCSFAGHGDSQILHDAINYAHNLGAVIVAAAGNDGADTSNSYPARYRSVITVGAQTWQDVLASYSNYGPRIETTALEGVYTTSSTNEYYNVFGTSIAAPQVSGVAALILAKNPTYTNEQVRQILHTSAIDIGTPGFDTSFGYGKLDAFNALSAPAPLEVNIVAPDAISNSTTAVFPIIGTARSVPTSSALSSWRLEVGTGAVPTSWTLLNSGSTNIFEQTITNYDPKNATEGFTSFRLSATDSAGRTFESRTNIFVDFAAITSPVSPKNFRGNEVYKPGAIIPIIASASQSGATGTTVQWAQGSNPTTGWSTTGITLTNPTTPYSGATVAQWDTSSRAAVAGDYYTIRVLVQYPGLLREARTLIYLQTDMLSTNWPKAGVGSFAMTLGPIPIKNAGGSTEFLFTSNSTFTSIGSIYRYTGNGTLISSTALNTGYYKQPAVGDLDGVTGDEIVIPETTKLRVYKTDNTSFLLTPNPAPANFLMGSSILMSDLDNDGKKEVLIAENATGYLYGWSVDVANNTGTQLFAIPISHGNLGFNYTPTNQIIALDLNGDGQKEIIFQEGDVVNGQQTVTLRAYNMNGSPFAGWTPSTFLNVRGFIGGDINGDGVPEIIVASNTLNNFAWTIHVLNTNGVDKTGWPIVLTDGAYPEINLADLDKDGRQEIIISTGPRMHIYKDTGQIFGNGVWPLELPGRIPGNYTIGPGSFIHTVIADVDGDTFPDIVGTTQNNLVVDAANAPPDISFTGDRYYKNDIVVYKRDGTLYKSWPLFGYQGNQNTYPTPAIGDFNNDGKTDIGIILATIVGGSGSGELEGGIAQILGTNSTFIPANNPWPLLNHDPQNSAVSSDTLAPSMPTGLNATNLAQTTLSLNWTISTDNVAVTGYKVFRNGTLLGSPTTNTFNVTGLNASTPYSFTVSAKDAAGNNSILSTALPVTTLATPDAIAPSVPVALAAANVTQTTLTLNWTASTDNVAVTGYKVFRNGTQIGTPTTNTFAVTGLSAATAYSFTVSAFDAAGNNSSLSTALPVTTLTTSDTTTPSVPTGLAAASVTQTSFILSWTASTDNIAVTGYKVFRNGTQIGTPTTNIFAVNGLTAATAYSFTVSTFDAAGNNSAASTALAVTTQTTAGTPVSMIDLSLLNGTQGLKLNGVRGSVSPGFADTFGFAIAGAGDINKDGKKDLIVGARDAEPLTDSQSVNRGRAYVVYGNTTANLTTLANGTTGFNMNLLNGTQGIAITGPNNANALFSNSLSGSGDYNGDGIADVLGGEKNFNGSGNGGESRGYVIYGDSAHFAGLNNIVVTQLAGTNTSGLNDVNTDGVDDGAQFTGLTGLNQGINISNAGDVDNDGIDDILVGNAERDTARGTDSGEAFLIFGNSNVNLDTLNPLGGANGNNVLSFRGQGVNDFAGYSVSKIGDINNDGFDDFAIGATNWNTDGNIYVIFGNTRTNLAALSSAINTNGVNATLSGSNGFRITNPPFATFGNMQVGAKMAALGDFNGDAIDDFVLSVPGLGLAFIIYGKTTPFTSTIDLTNVMNTQSGGFPIAAGVSDVSGAGDINNDGRKDLIIGTIGSNESYILFGTNTITPLIRNVTAFSTSMVDLTDGVSFNGSGVNLQPGGYLYGKGVLFDGVASSSTGASVAGIGDFNGDGFDDIAIGAPNATTPTSSGNPAGQAFIVYGQTFLGATDTTAPSVPTGLAAASVTQTTLTLNWTASTDNVAVTGYKVFRNGTQVGTPTTNTFAVTGLTASTTYSFTVSTNDAAGNNSAVSSALAVTTLATPDTTAPNVPTGLAAASVTQTTLTLNWTASTDNVAVTGYKVFRNGTQIGTPTTNTFSVTGLTASTAYSFTVSANDAAGNNSTQSSALSVTTLAPPDTTNPSVPTNLLATAISASQINLSWTASTDNVGVTGYRVYRDGTLLTTLGNVTTYSNTGLTASTAYSYTVAAIDAAGNASAQSSSSAATTPSTTALTSINVTNLNGTNGFSLRGEVNGEQVGRYVAGIGDLNGDSLDDIIISGSGVDNTITAGGGEGRAYVILGKTNGSTLNGMVLNSLDGTNGGFFFNGGVQGGASGTQVVTAGDMNGDGMADLAIGTPTLSGSTGSSTGIYWGRAGTNFSSSNGFNLENLSPTVGPGLKLIAPGQGLGLLMDGGGDFNGDGKDDLAVGQQNIRQGFLVFGKTSFSTNLSLTDTTPTTSSINYRTSDFNDGFGAIGFAGDVDNDGYDDLLIGVPGLFSGDNGRVVLLYGTATPASLDNIDLSTLTDSTTATIFDGPTGGGELGRDRVIGIGDINDDGYNDFAMVAPYTDPNGRINAGSVYVVFGNPSRTALNAVNLSTLNGTTGFRVDGGTSGVQSGYELQVAAAGDFNGDGIDDFMVGDPGFSGLNGGGHVYLIYGSRSSFANFNGDNLNTVINGIMDQNGDGKADGMQITGVFSLGRNMAPAGDVNGDGYDDLLLGAFMYFDGGNIGAAYVVYGGDFSGQPADTISPTTPGSPAAVANSTTQITVTWSASTDTGGSTLRGYNIYRNGSTSPLNAIPQTGTSFVNTGLSASTAYSYQIEAIDHAGNKSAKSSSVSATTLAIPDTTAPSVPTGLAAANVTQTTLTLNWTASTDNVAVTGYKVFRNGTQIGTPTTNTFAVTGLTAATAYSFTVSANDAAGNNSAVSTALPVTTPAAPDTTAPSVPTGLAAVSVTQTSLTLNWTASTDNVAVTGYKVFKGGVQIGTPTTNTFAVTGLTAATAYSFTVSAFDAAGNNSAQSSALSVTTQAAGNTPVAEIDLSLLNGTSGLKFNGVRGSLSPGFDDVTGFTVAGVGDINGDGKSDFIIGARDGELLTDSQAQNRGRAFVIFGNTTANLSTLANGTTGFNLNLLNGTQGITLNGTLGINSEFSYTLSGGGDYNGDGLADVLGTENRSNDGKNSHGFVLYGNHSLSSFNNIVMSQLSGSNTSGLNDVNSDGIDDGAQFGGLNDVIMGVKISNAGDIDRDGISDILVGNPERTTTRGTNSGAAFLVFGNSNATLDTLSDLGGANGTNVLSFFGQGTNDYAGYSVSSIGDINNDSFGDFAIGATNGFDDGKFYVIFGNTRANLATLANNIKTNGMNATLNGTNGFSSVNAPFASVANPAVGTSIAGIGDFNGDGISDFVVNMNGLGLSIVIYGKTTSFTSTLDLTNIMNTRVGGFAIASGSNDVEGAGDVNGDGLADIIIGNSASNQAFILFGTNNITPLIQTAVAFDVGVVDLTDGQSVSGSGINLKAGGYLYGKGVLLTGPASSGTGTSVAGIGDINGDGFSDVILGAIFATAPTAIGNPAGQAYVVYGQIFKTAADATAPSVPTGLAAANVTQTTLTLNWTASTDNVAVTGYKVFRNGTQIGTPTTNTFAVTGLTAATAYSFTVSANDAAGNNSAVSTALPVTTPATPDTTAPSVPTGLAAANVTQTTLTLNWTASTDNVSVTGYKVFRNGTQIGTPTTNTFAVTGLTASTAYSFTVSANDTAGNNSAVSTALAVTTPDTTAPSVPTGLAVTNLTPTSLTINWTASTDNVAVTGYKVFRNGTQIGTPTTNSLAVTGLTASTAYSFTVSANDAAGNNSAQSTALPVTTPAAPDTTAPSVPTGLATASVTQTTLTLNWTASTDNVAVTGYKVFRNGTQIGTPTTNTFAVTGLTVNTAYSFTVSANDAAGNNSSQSTALAVTTPDTTAPSVPTGLAAASVTQTTLTLNWAASTDNVAVTGYKVFQNSVQIGTPTTNSFAVTGLTVNTAYSFTVSANDAAGNNSAVSTALPVTTPDTTAPSVPTGLAAASVTQTSLALNWTASTDNVAVTGYKVFRNGTQIGTPTTNTFAVTGLTASTAYSFTVSANDAGGNNSAQSTAFAVTTPDTTAPSVPTGLAAASVTQTSLTLNWTASTDNVAVTGYKVFRNGTQIGTPTTNTFAVTGLTASTAYSFTVSANDAAGNNSSQSAALAVTTPAPPDTLTPSVPAGLAAVSLTGTSFTLNWTASTDNVAVTGYKVFRNGTQIGTATTNTFAVTGLTPSTTYSFTVSANDAAGNNSAQSTALPVTTPDTLAPSVPTGLATSSVTATSGIISWAASTDNVGGSGVKGYFIYRNGSSTALNATALTTTSYSDTGLSSSTLYSYTVASIDNVNNLSAKSGAVSFTTAVAGAFTNTGSLANGRISSTMTLLPNGKVLVAGGLTNNGSVYTTLASAALYDPATGTFSPTGNMTSPRLLHSAVLLTNGKVLLSGGFNDANAATPLTNAEIYDPTTGTFTPTGSMVNGQYGATATLLNNGKVLILRGSDAQLYNPSTGQFTATNSPIVDRYYHSATLLQNGKVLVVSDGSAELFDPNTNQFTLTGNTSVPRYYHSATLLANGKVLIAAGRDANAPINTAEIYDPATGTFTAAGDTLTFARMRHTATLLAGGKVLIVGGQSAAGVSLVNNELYDPATNQFVPTGNSTIGRKGHNATILTTGKVLVTSGDPGTYTSIAIAELFDLGDGLLPTNLFPGIDITAPSVPASPSAVAVSSTSITISWTASTDNVGGVGVQGYYLYRNGSSTPINATPNVTTSFTNTGLTPSTLYSYTIAAADNNGNQSAKSISTSATTLAPPDTTAPSVPTNLTAASVTETSLTLNWTSSTDNTAVTGYKVFRNGTQIGTPTTNTFAVTGLTAGTAYSFTVSANDAAGNNSSQSSALPVTTADTTVPSVPTGLAATNLSSTSFTLNWTASTDNVAVTGYKVFRNGTQIGTPTTNTFAVTGLTASTAYSFTVSANDATGNNSAQSSALAVTTLAAPDTTAPSVPTGLAAASVTETSLTLNWTASTDNTAVTGYKVFRNATQIGTPTTNTFTVTGLTAGTAYSFTVSANDAASNNSAQSTALPVTTPDTTAPSVPTGLAAANLSSTSFTLNWTAATDNVAVTGYKVFRNGTQIGTPTTNTFAVTGLTASTAYSFTVSANDATGNNSAQSSALAVTTLATPDTTAPSVPTSLASASLTATTFTLNWTASTDNIGVTGYKVFRNGTQIGTPTTNTFAVTGLSGSTTYSFTVSANDAAGNNSAQSSALSVTTPAAPDTTAPSVPTGLTTSNIGATSATISWNASTDNAGGSGVKGYFIYRNGNATALNATAVTTTTYTDTGLSSSTLYSYTVAAIDNANNLSAKSSSASLTTTIAGTFINTGSLAKGRISSTMTLLPNGKVLVAGGLTNSGSVYTTLASAELYDPTTGTFSPTGNMTTPRLIHSAVLLTNGKVLISGGFNDANAAAPLTSAEIYDPTTGIFTATGSMINGQYGSTSTLLSNGKVLILRGSDAEIYNPTTSTFTLAGSTVVERYYHSATLLQNGKVLVVSDGSAELFDPNTNQFTATGNTSVPRYYHTATLLANGKVLIASGRDANAPINTAELYDPITGTFTPAGDTLTFARMRHTATLLAGGKVLIVGGQSAAGVSLVNSELYDPVANQFVPTGNLTIGRKGHQTTILTSGKVLVTSGDPGTYTSIAVTELYDLGDGLLPTNLFPGVDTVAPSVPTSPSATAASSTSITVTWTASTDNVGGTGVQGYYLYRNGSSTPVNATPNVTTSFTNTGLTASTLYSYTIAAVDNNGNISAKSSSTSATTLAPPDTTAPSVPTGLAAASVTQTTLTLNWTASTDNTAVAGYKVFRNGTQIGTPTTNTFSVTGLTAGTSYSFTVSANDAAGNNSSQSTALPVTTTDTVLPSVPTGLAAANLSSTSFTLNWTASTDNAVVTGYKVFKDGVQVGTPTTNTFAVTGLTASTAYSFTVSSFDAAGNNSSQSSALAVTTTAGPDITAPSVPTGLASANLTATSLTLNWTASTDNVGVTGYKVFRNATQIGTPTTNTFAVTGLSGSTTYSFTVSANDAAGNNSAQSSALSVTTPAAPDTTAPSVPTGLTTSNIGTTSGTISWNASTDNAGGSGVQGYFIYRNGSGTALNATALTTATYTDTGLSSSTLYSYAVASVDNLNNLSAKSSSVSFTTTIAGTFINTGSLAKGRISSTMTLLPNGKVLVAGGLTNSASVYTTLASAELYDPTTGTFSPTGNMTTPRLLHSAVLLTNGKVLISGGFNDANAAAPLTSSELYDPATGIFTPTGSMINGQYGSTATLLNNGKVLILRGSDAEIYNPTTSTFTLAGSTVVERYYHTATLLTNGKVLVVSDGSAELFDPNTNQFTATGNTLVPRYYHTATLLASGKVLIASGRDANAPINTAEIYDPSTGAFTAAGDILTFARMRHTATLLAGGKVLITGGQSTSGVSLVNNELYDPTTNQFVPTGSLTIGRKGHRATILTNGKVLVTSGDPGDYTSIAITELFDIGDGILPTNLFPGVDTTAPSVPASPSAVAASSTSITVSWTASTDNVGGVGVQGYYLYRNGSGTAVNATPITTTSYTNTGLTASTLYSYTVASMDNNGNISAKSSSTSATTLAPPDTTAPSVPTGLAAASVTQTTLTLNWTASTDNTAVTGYKVFRNGTQIGTPTTNTFSVTGLTAGTSYSFTVSANDAAGNNSAQSTALAVTTTDTVLPSVPTGLVAANLSSTSFTLNWTAATDNGVVTGYKVFRNGTQIGTPTTNTFAVTGLTASTTYSFTVSSTDSAGNNSAQSTTLSVTTLAAPDTTAPSVPIGLASASVTQTTLTLNWTASTDNVGVTGYKVFRNGTQIGTPTTNTFAVTGLTAGTSYSFTVSANDAAGNNSAQSSALAVTTPDTTAPSVPTSLASANLTATGFTLSWTASTDNAAVTGYKVFRNGTQIGTPTTNTFAVTGLTASTTYSFTVSANDAAGNNSAQSSALSITTPVAGLPMGSAYAQFKLNDNAANTSVLDSIGGNDGVANGNTSSFSTTGKINSAFAFNGTSKSVDLSNLLSGIKGDDVGSISVWVKPVNDTGAILSFNGNGGSFSVDWYKANQSANFSISGAGTPISCTTQTGSLPTNVFSHLVITQDGTQFKIYLNGVLQTITYWYNSDPGAWLSFLPSTINNAKLGSTIYQGAEYFFQGSADDLRYYKRALTANEVQALYSNGSGTEAPNPLAAP